MKLHHFFIWFLCFLVFPVFLTESKAQVIVAGQVSQSDTYTDVNPDSLFEAAPYHHSNLPGGSIQLDTDSDGVHDIGISAWGGGGLGGGGGSCIVAPLIPNAEIIAHLDTSQGCCPQQYIALVADTLLAGDTISELKTFYANSVYIWSTTYGGQMAPIVNQWNGIGEHFIGFRLCYSFDTLYGWIRVEVSDTSHFIISIKDYAVNRNTHIGIREEITANEIIVYPNPFSDKLTIESSLNAVSEIKLYSVLGTEVIQKFSGEMELEIGTSGLKQGMYFYEVLSGDEVYRGKVLKR